MYIHVFVCIYGDRDSERFFYCSFTPWMAGQGKTKLLDPLLGFRCRCNCPSTCIILHYSTRSISRKWIEIEQPGLEQVLTWDADVTDDCFTHYTMMPVPEMVFLNEQAVSLKLSQSGVRS